ncbi:5780_t:CDS:2, partial [Acaulospora colombiana]
MNPNPFNAPFSSSDDVVNFVRTNATACILNSDHLYLYETPTESQTRGQGNGRSRNRVSCHRLNSLLSLKGVLPSNSPLVPPLAFRRFFQCRIEVSSLFKVAESYFRPAIYPDSTLLCLISLLPSKPLHLVQESHSLSDDLFILWLLELPLASGKNELFTSAWFFISLLISPSCLQSLLRIITDRFALHSSLPQSTPCNVADQAFCGGTWNAITENLDYIQSMGFSAIWISPVHKNYDGPRTAYGDAYHGYWVTDIGQLNDRFGTAADLKSLSDEEQYHPYCPMRYGDMQSEQHCWMGDTKVALMDVNTEDPEVISSYSSWIKDFVQQYNIDGLRLDAAKHVRGDFWPPFCQTAGVFCMGEVYEQEATKGALWQTDSLNPTASSSATGGSGSDPAGMDSILNFPLYWTLDNTGLGQLYRGFGMGV